MENKKKHAYWIHDRKEEDSSMTGYLYLPSCKCSNCGYHSTMEKKVCPECGCLMDLTAPADAESDTAK
jgi:uncharacterized OB-fold protein